MIEYIFENKMPFKNKNIDLRKLRKTFRIREEVLERLFRKCYWRPARCNKSISDGYLFISFDGNMVRYHKIIWCLFYGNIPVNSIIDHRDGNKLNNKIDNLRVVSQRENMNNTYKQRKGKLVGCSLDKRSHKWQARIKNNGKDVYLGLYETEAEAHKKYLAAKLRLSK